MRRALATVVFVLLPVLLLIARQQTRTETAMAAAAKTLLSALDADQRAKISYAFDNEERQNWWFVPRNRNGLPLKEMTPAQRDAAFALLKTGLSEKGFSKAEAIRGLEPVLKAMENNSPTRDIERYFFTIFGEPGSDRWGWRYEGHHLSQNWTIVRGKAVSTTPSFFGANPAEIRDGPQKGQRALPVESDLAWKFFRSLTPEQLKVAIVATVSPTEIITSNARKAAMIDAKGLDMQSMTAPQRAMLLELIREYANSQGPELAQTRLAKLAREPLDQIVFAWLGGTDPSQGHYYRIQSHNFLIEYDNTQNNANHQHTVWRDFAGDFGADLLAEHYAEYKHK